MITFNPGDDVREQVRAKMTEYESLLDAMQGNGVIPPDHPAWRDPHFHKMVSARLFRVERVFQDAKKWEAVKELFREAGRAHG